MSLPSEYAIEDAIGSIDDVVVYCAAHPIHGKVNVYQPDPTLPPALAEQVRRRLYENGLQMRNLALRDIPLAAKALEVSQDPREPYIVTTHTKHNLEDLISNGITMKPKRMFTILSQVLQAIINLAANGYVVRHLQARHIKLAELEEGDISFDVVEAAVQQSDVGELAGPGPDADAKDQSTPQASMGPTVRFTEKSEATQTSEDIAGPAAGGRYDFDSFGKSPAVPSIEDTKRQLRRTQRNIYALGSMTYQLLFGRKYDPQDKVAAANISKLAGRWRRILQKALCLELDRRYDRYESMLEDLRKSLSRNRRIAIASVPFLVLLVLVASYFAYERYHRHKIMTSEAGQAIERFLDIVNKTQDELPEPQKPEASPSVPDEESILRPFEKIEPVEE